MNAPASIYTATRSGLTTYSPWNSDALIAAGLLLLFAGSVLQVIQASRNKV